MNAVLNVVKIGGNVIDDPAALGDFLTRFAALEGPKVLVHGGGKEATRMSAAMGVETKMVDGRRITGRDTLDIVTMVYAGLINKRVVARLQALGCNAAGLTGADGNAVPATRRAAAPVDYGFVGDIDPARVSRTFLRLLTDRGLVPVMCAICHDGAGTLLNCNADSVAAAVAAALAHDGPVRLTYCFEKHGVLADVDDPASVIPLVTESSFADLRSRGVVAQGMVPKLTNALASARAGVKEVRICRAEDLLEETGTIIKTE